ncbi:AraC family transcriptional regulator [Vibrio sp. CK2-1]|uniref:helix-turn-helix domain-containing protein n=1 Tax=Vibrio sp. CK2-1 TaxID=2912249 RepID=UPI001F419216|nr:AraC family transcriptional regulator [Vibrio sp. CK2-1]MCF7354773.1 AraC family transcriptional regulator [Vibrio sp. CK2-1]
MHLVRSGAASHFEKLILELGYNPIQLMHQVGLRQAEFRDPNTYISYAKLAELLDLAAIKTNQPLFGLTLAQTQTQEVLGDLPMLVSRMETVEMALLKANEYLYLHAYGVQVKMQSKDEYIQLKITLNIDSDVNIQPLMQLSVYHLALFVAGLLNVEVDTLPLHFSQAEPALTQEQKEKLSHPLLFNQAFDGIQLKASQLAHKNHRDEQALNQLITHRLQKLQSRYPEDIADQVKGLIRHLLPTGECCIERIANALGMHHRSLQTQLKNKQQSYRSLLLQTRQEIAKHQLINGSQTITELALQLGYVDIAVFSRHFKTWTGLSPSQWKKQKTHEFKR